MADNSYDSLAARLTNPETPLPDPANVRTGADAAAAGRALLVREYGSEEALGRALRPGRPRLGDRAQGASPTVRGRISVQDFAAFKLLEERTGRRQSDLVREAVQLLLTEYHLRT